MADWLDFFSLIASAATAGAVLVALYQIWIGWRQAGLQFEDQLSAEYRNLIRSLPTRALLGERLSREQLEGALSVFYHYFDLSNEQAFLHEQGRISGPTWKTWKEGIEQHFRRPAFRDAWSEISARAPDSFGELRRLLLADRHPEGVARIQDGPAPAALSLLPKDPGNERSLASLSVSSPCSHSETHSPSDSRLMSQVPSSSQPKPERRTEVILPLALFALVILMWGGYWYLVERNITGMDPASARGLFGDMFGGANALFSALAFAGLIYAIVLQRKDLRLQQEELIHTRGVMIAQEEQMAAQAKTLRLQQFENTFFQLVALHHEIVRGMVQVNPPAEPVVGRDALKFIVEEAREVYVHSSTENRGQLILNVNRSLQQQFGQNLGHYFRNLYHIAKFVHESGLDDRKRYMSFLRAQLSHAELVLLFINSLDPKFVAWQEYIFEYALFEPMPKWRFDGETLRLYSDERAYGDNGELLTLYRQNAGFVGEC